MKEEIKNNGHIYQLPVLQLITKFIIIYQHKITHNEETPSNFHSDSQESLPGTYKNCGIHKKLTVSHRALNVYVIYTYDINTQSQNPESSKNPIFLNPRTSKKCIKVTEEPRWNKKN